MRERERERKTDALESLTRGSAQPRAGMEQSIEPSFFVGSVAGSIDFASIGSQANYGRSHCPRYIIRWRPEVSFSSPRFRGGYDQLFVADAVFVGRSGRKRRRRRRRREREREGSAREVAAASFFLRRGCALPLFADTLARSVMLSTEVSFGSSREACGSSLI